MVPHSYLTNLKAVLGSKGRNYDESKIQVLTNPTKIGIALTIPKSSRFSQFKSTGPGPADYNISSNTSHNSLFPTK
jgi:hypothetical protein